MVTLSQANLYIDGAVRGAAGGKTYDVVGPWTGEVIGAAADASSADVEEAIAAARRAFDTTDWSTNHALRLDFVKKLRDKFVENRELLIEISRHQTGAALGAVQRAQVVMALDGFNDLIDLFPEIVWEKDRGTRTVMGSKSRRKTINEAIGVVAAITPWNFPLYINIAKVASALLAGCTVILKPAPNTPSAATVFGELASQIGLPPGVLNVITGADPVMSGEMLVADPRVDLITFTGSTPVGKRIMEKGAATLKRVFLELGGKSAKIILDDAPNFAQEVMQSILVFHAGQGCAVQSRLLVPRSRYGEAVEALRQAYAGYSGKWGNFDDPSHMMGPIVSAKQLERVKSYVELGKQEGATLLAGGNLRPDIGSGFFIEPTCFVDVTNDMRIAREEIFGPVLVVIPFEDDADALRIANDSDFGLSGGIVSADLDRALRMAGKLRSGTVSVNNGACVSGDLPFGGYKHSGIGREWGIEGIEEYLETKTLAYPV